MLYTHSTLDRADAIRKDDTALQALRRRPDTCVIPVWRGTVPVTSPDTSAPPRRVCVPAEHYPVGDAAEIFLGLIDQRAYFAVNCNAQDEPPSLPNGEFADLRLIGAFLPADEAALLAYARGMVYWHDTVSYCPRCGHALGSALGGHTRPCLSNTCNNIEFPRTDPAVIMLVTLDASQHQPEQRCLLGRSPGWPEGVYSTLAGFVEPGESLEQAVQREVWEEAGVRTDQVKYIASQPWPFPRSIMLGFESRAITHTLNIDPAELEDARWFTREEIEAFGTWGDEQPGFKMPRRDSIARYLIDRWMTHSDRHLC